jgi:hypothetical protein
MQRVAGEQDAFSRGVSKPTLRARYTHLDQLSTAREQHLAALHGMGPTALEILRRSLKQRGKDFQG